MSTVQTASARITDRGIEIDGVYQPYTTRIQLDLGVPPELPRIVVDYLAVDFSADVNDATIEHRVYIAGIHGTGASVRDAVADVLRQMDAAA